MATSYAAFVRHDVFGGRGADAGRVQAFFVVVGDAGLEEGVEHFVVGDDGVGDRFAGEVGGDGAGVSVRVQVRAGDFVGFVFVAGRGEHAGGAGDAVSFGDEGELAVGGAADPLAAVDGARGDLGRGDFGVEGISQDREGDAAVFERLFGLQVIGDHDRGIVGSRAAAARIGDVFYACFHRRFDGVAMLLARRPTLKVLMRSMRSPSSKARARVSGLSKSA